MIVCPQPQAAEIGLDVMRRGGNAVDAAVTCAFVQGVVDPQMCGIGGCGVMLVHSPQSGDALLEFYATAGSRVREHQWESIFVREAADRYGSVLDGWFNDVGYRSVRSSSGRTLRGAWRGWRAGAQTPSTRMRLLKKSLWTSRPTADSSPGKTWRTIASTSPSRFAARIEASRWPRPDRRPAG